MKKTTLVMIASLVVLAQSSALSHPQLPPTVATDVTNADVLTLLKQARVDQQIKVVDIGKYNVAVGILHRGAPRAGAPPADRISALSHNHITEVYYIISGAGTLVTGGTMADGRPTDLGVLAGPSLSGYVQNGRSRQVGPGDIIIIPPGVPHGFSVIDDHVDYLSVRVDADHVLPAGYVHEAIKGGRSK